MNLGAEDSAYIRQGGALFVKLDRNKIHVITNTDLRSAVDTETARRMEQKEGGRYRIYEQTIYISDIVDMYDNPQNMIEELNTQNYPTPSDLIVEIARQGETSRNMTNTDNFWGYLRNQYGISSP